MPTIVFRRFPLPSISLYVILSIALLVLSVIWANNTLIEEQDVIALNKTSTSLMHSEPVKPNDNDKESKEDELSEVWNYPSAKSGKNSESSITFSVKKSTLKSPDEPFIGTEIAKSINAGNYSFSYGVFKLMMEEPLCLILVVNATYCVLALVMRVIQTLVFGKLRPIERQHLKDKFWNFVFYKFIFIFGVMNVQSLNEVLVWVSWFTVIAFLLFLTKLSKDRFEFLSFSPNTPMSFHWKVVVLLMFMLCSCILLAISCVTSTFPFSAASSINQDIHSITFMLAECVILSIKTTHVILRYSIHLYDVQHAELWERKATYVYHTDLIMELLSLFVNFLHHLHMLFSGNIWLSMASLVICMQLRYIFSEIRKRLLKHKNYRRVVANMEAQFPAATQEEINTHADRCAICWDQMESARKLPCGHFFHAACLRSWLEQDTTCPTCRKQLDIQNNVRANRVNNIIPNDDNDNAANVPGGRVPPPQLAAGLNPLLRIGRHRNFWHFDGSRFASWLPSFSVEVMHSAHGAQAMVTTTRQNSLNEEMSNSQLDTMVREVQEIFPQIPARAIANDLRITGSVEVTSENILEGNIALPDPLVQTRQASLQPTNSQSDYQRPMPSNPDQNPDSLLRRRNVSTFSTSDHLIPRLPSSVLAHPLTPSISAPGDVGTSSSISPVTAPITPGGAIGGHFSKAPHEREIVLSSRREMLVRQARLKYLNNQKQLPMSDEEDTSKVAPSSSTEHTFQIGSLNTNLLGQANADAGTSFQNPPFQDNLMQLATTSGSSSSARGILPRRSIREVSQGNLTDGDTSDESLD
ncbi:E3 ubiquitin-protein ligase AMFR-like [Clavelina lepadiformis]|uniref:Autocrine motility factor receptor n=1 Tax=Clavelina lepadiformis TaxID=159417 RepID=A0ABP0H2W5_CLALP